MELPDDETYGSQYDDSEAAIANYDQLKATALDKLKECDSFLVIAGFVNDDTQSGMALTAISATKTPFAPYFLAEALHVSTAVMLQSIEALADEAEA